MSQGRVDELKGEIMLMKMKEICARLLQPNDERSLNLLMPCPKVPHRLKAPYEIPTGPVLQGLQIRSNSLSNFLVVAVAHESRYPLLVLQILA